MKKKVVSIIILLLIIGAFIANHLITYARIEETPLYVKLSKTDLEGNGYGNGNPNPTQGGTSNKGEYIWNILTQNSITGPTSEKQKELYCVKADYGQTWFTEQKDDQIIEYNLSYDMQKDREALLGKLKDNGNDADEIIKALLDPQGKQYRQLLWIFDNAYTKGDNIDDFLAKVGIFSYEHEGQTYYYKIENGIEIDYPNGEKLTEADIIAIQKMAIWYFTNGEEYDKTDEDLWLFITSDGTNYSQLKTLSESRNAMAMDLYKFLIDKAQIGANEYTSENNYQIEEAPVNVNTSDLIQEDNKYIVNTVRDGENYYIGPIEIQKNNEQNCNIEITVKDQNGKILNQDTDYKYTDDKKTELNQIELNDLIGIPGGFYIKIARNLIESVNIEIKASYQTTTKKLWLQGDETKDEIKLKAEQPLVELIPEPKELVVELISKPEEFDLALRKYIVGLHDKKGTQKEIPNARHTNNIDLSTLSTGTTATYKHRKDPVVVADGDEVTYQIIIYNEGNKPGYATQIIDQLPVGLIRSTNTTSTITSKGKDGKTKNTYNVSYNTITNQIILEIVNTNEKLAQSLQPYTISGELDYEIIEIKCKVAQKADIKKQIILTNVAWINEAYNEEDQKTITTEIGLDRDSEPYTLPKVENTVVNKTNMENYKGNTSNPDDLSQDEYFYQGQQDDDDFEKVVIMPIEKIFDLALFKHIAAISKDEIIENGEYITDTGNKDGTYLRAPVVKSIDPDTGKITYDQDDKAALTVEPGDYVLYTIRVYNEGEINGYASKIKDTLPIGLEFVVENEEYNGIWKLDGVDSDGRQVVTTTWYAKGQGAELNAVEGDANYKANLLKALNKEEAISNENPDYIDAQVLCKVVEQATSSRVLVNYAQISEHTDENGNKDIEDIDSTPDKWIDTDDDQDIERIQLQYFDLSLRKFITEINGIELKNENGKYIREPIVDVSKLVNQTDTTAVYTHPKKTVSVQVEDKIVYTIRVYNEGSINGFANEVTDYLPPYLEFVKNSEINANYEWEISEDGRIVTTTYLKDKELKAFNGTKLDYVDLKIECMVSENAPLKQNQTNIAEISEYKYNGNIVSKDIDSVADNMVSKQYLPTDENLSSYKDEEINKPYVPGNEDDDDFEKVYVKEFDLALRKFITQVQNKEVTTRVPQIKNENGNISYEHPKDPLVVHTGDVVIYTLRIYNEGEISGYANEITDDIPEYLEYLPEDSTNVEYMWKMYDENGKETQEVENAVKVKTTYLSKENGEDNLINAFDGNKLSYKDIKIAFKVKDPNSNSYIITNHAQISDDRDENNNPIKDKDSEPDKWNEGEDDQDIENIKVEYFDLALLKFVTKVIVIEDGKETITETGYNGHEDPEPVVKVELHRKKLNKVTVKFGFGITITNEGDIPGYAKEITDYVPEGLKFDPTDNPEWKDEGNNVISTRQLENVLLQPGESRTVEVILTWINGSDNLSLKTNTAEISEDDNEYDVPDRDSTPDNKKAGEDDIDIAKVILAVSTGSAKTYFTLTLVLLIIIATGVILIKKFVI